MFAIIIWSVISLTLLSFLILICTGNLEWLERNELYLWIALVILLVELSVGIPTVILMIKSHINGV